jgi:thiamine pyrophosphate-dependent acetolactate synthase large subunit-like protein
MGSSLQSTTFQRVGIGGMARACGIDALRADTVAEYREVVEQAARAKRPVLVEATLEVDEWQRISGAP